ncbi:hypothetical protein MTR_4g026730 [Medicago truncatula]|uniref:Uncharacterized protein n=1 Tax=Medicago truncatula TaxID=3880 RepID=G7JH09_MEDTR|nr:hypothetical protein MTR_4g026730 [Medicago truncatula]
MNFSVVTPTSTTPPCGASGISGHTSIECQLRSVVEIIEKINFVQNNQGMRLPQNFYKNPRNPLGETTPPSIQRVAQKSITMQAQKKAPPNMHCIDEFLIQSIVTRPGFLQDSGYKVEVCKLRVVFLSMTRKI